MSRALSAPSVVVVGSGQVASVVALTLSKNGTQVRMGVRDPAIRTSMASAREFDIAPRRTVAWPKHVQVFDSSSSSAVEEALAHSSSVIVCVPSSEVLNSMASIGIAAKNLPSLAPIDGTLPPIAGGVEFDMDLGSRAPPASSTKEITRANCLPIILMSRGVTRDQQLLSKAVRNALPHLPSCVSVLPPFFLNHWISASIGAVEQTPQETVDPRGSGEKATGNLATTNRRVTRAPFILAPDGAMHVFPSLKMGASATASMRSRDAAVDVLSASFDLNWEREHVFDDATADQQSSLSSPSDAASFVDVMGAICVAASFAGGLVSGRWGSKAVLQEGLLRNIIDASNNVLRSERCAGAMDGQTLAVIASAIADNESREARFGRKLVDIVHIADTAGAVFRNGNKSPHFVSMESSLSYLAARDPFFAGLFNTFQGVFRSTTVAETIWTRNVMWSGSGRESSAMHEAFDSLDAGVQSGSGQEFKRSMSKAAEILAKAGLSPSAANQAVLASLGRQSK